MLKKIGYIMKNDKKQKALVSIVFMFSYWGSTLDEFFSRLKSQKTNFLYEIVVAYYGTSEDVYKKLCSLADKVVRISPFEYNCGSTRDLACKASSGKYIATLSVDSLPLNNNWLSEIVRPLIKNEADVVQGKIDCPNDNDQNYPDFFYWERDYGFYFTSEAEKFIKKCGDFGDNGCFGFAAPNLAFKKTVWEKTGFGGVRYNGDNIFQKRVYQNGFKTIYNDSASVLHAHSYKTVKSLFNRCSNEGLGWRDIGEAYELKNFLKDICRFDLHLKAISLSASGKLKYNSEKLFHFIRPIALFWGNHYAKKLYNDSRK